MKEITLESLAKRIDRLEALVDVLKEAQAPKKAEDKKAKSALDKELEEDDDDED